LLVQYPQEVIAIMDMAAWECYAEYFPAEAAEAATDPATARFLVRPHNLERAITMRSLDPSDIDRLVCIHGMVTRVSPIVPDLKIAHFVCSSCGATQDAALDRGRIDEPDACGNCRGKRSMQLVHNGSRFADKQMLRLQEAPDDIPAGETPHSVSLVAFDDLADCAKPGDRVHVTGIYRAVPVRENPRQSVLKSVYRTYVDVIHVAIRDLTPSGDKVLTEADANEAPMIVEAERDTSDMEAEFRALAGRPDVYEVLVNSVAPSIYEMEDVKRGVLCQLFGGVHKEFANTDARFRGDINVLLVGDPAVSKSQLLQYVHRIAPRGMYTSGKGSSAVGLTAYVAKDPETREYVLESGALVLSDRGICCIDEFDKMGDSARSILHEAMEQQTVSIAKAGIIATLNARTSILASANPVESRYNPRLSVVENIMLPPTLLSRFDLIYLVLDRVSEASDLRLAKHLVGMYESMAATSNQPAGRVQGEATEKQVSLSFLTKYISFAKKTCNPQITDAANRAMVDAYVAMRRAGSVSNKKIITATPRQLESLVRISESLARMRLSLIVEERDVTEAVRLVKVALQQAAVDPRTGQIDMDLITTGHSVAERVEVDKLAQTLRQALTNRPQGGPQGDRLTMRQIHELLGQILNKDVTLAEVRNALTALENDGLVRFVRDRNLVTVLPVKK
jgi:DNA replication licensing factor MCM4